MHDNNWIGSSYPIYLKGLKMDLQTNILAPSQQVNALANSNTRPQSVVINDKRDLYKSYMPYIKTGGLFIPFNNENVINTISINKKAFILLNILNKKLGFQLFTIVFFCCGLCMSFDILF